MKRQLNGSGSIAIEFRVVEYSDGEPPETFGFVQLTSIPKPGDVVQLRWLDGRDAHGVRVDRVNDFTLHVRRS